MKKIGGFLAFLAFFALSCTGYVAKQETYRPAESQSWWGSDPTCAPGCPAGRGAKW